jgi:rhodanese-related sulfurtransferase
MTSFFRHNGSMKMLVVLFILTSCLPSKPDQVASKNHWVEQMAKTIALKYQDIDFLSPRSLQELLKQDSNAITLIDARTLEERNISTIGNAISLDRDLQPFAQSHLVYYCTNGERSAIEAQKAIALGFQQVSVLAGGILLWAHQQGKFVDAQGQATQEVHIFSKAWNFLPEGYHAILP